LSSSDSRMPVLSVRRPLYLVICAVDQRTSDKVDKVDLHLKTVRSSSRPGSTASSSVDIGNIVDGYFYMKDVTGKEG
jgi:hypothetical protein